MPEDSAGTATQEKTFSGAELRAVDIFQDFFPELGNQHPNYILNMGICKLNTYARKRFVREYLGIIKRDLEDIYGEKVRLDLPPNDFFQDSTTVKDLTAYVTAQTQRYSGENHITAVTDRMPGERRKLKDITKSYRSIGLVDG
jgi:hypothetical protein